jgi:cytoskeletal protein RodZ
MGSRGAGAGGAGAGGENVWEPPTPQDTQQDTQEDDLASPEKPRKRFGLGILVILLILIIAGSIGYQRLFAGTQQQTTTPAVQREANMLPTVQSAAGSNTNGNDGETEANPPKNSNIDLQAKIIGIFPEKPKVGDVVNVQVEISNTGSQAITDPFWVDLYVSPSAVPTANIAWNDISPYGAAWLVEKLEAQETLVLESLGADASRSNLLRFPAAEIHTLQVLVDSYGLTGTGAIVEQHEDNNLSETREIDIAPGGDTQK